MPATESLTFAQTLRPAAPPFETLYERYRPLVELAGRLLGVVANGFPYMEIWPTSFRTYNLLVPNFINVPFSLLSQKAPLSRVGLGMYASSRAAQCMYCSAHCCAVAMRGGLEADKLTDITDDNTAHSPGERALIVVARGLGTVPSTLTSAQVQALHAHYDAETVDWLVHGIAMMGFLNKMMDTMGFDLEAALVDEVHDAVVSSGWSAGRHRVMKDDRASHAYTGSTLRILSSMIRFMPGAILRDKRWTKGVPTDGARANALLESKSGYDFPMVRSIRQGRVVRALTTMIRDNLEPQDSPIGLLTKHLAGVVFATRLFDDELTKGERSMATHARLDVPASLLNALEQFGLDPGALDTHEALDRVEQTIDAAAGTHLTISSSQHAALLLAKAAAPSPAQIPTAIVERCRDRLTPEQTMELITWLSILSTLHRRQVFDDCSNLDRASP